MYRARLEALMNEVQLSLQAARGLTTTVELDQSRVGRLSRMDALQQQALGQATLARRAAHAKHIELALARLEQGTYGLCLNCDQPIAIGRLDLDPAVRLCINCAD